MATINELSTRFDTDERTNGNMLDAQGILAQAIAATSFYAGYAALVTHLAIPLANPAPDSPAPYPAITSATDLTVSEWAIIRSLFLLYVERENALQLEASRGFGVDVFGRSSSEVAGDIVQMELDLPHRASNSPVFTI